MSKPSNQYPIERFISIRRYSTFDFLRQDSSWIIYAADLNGQFNLWRQRSYLSPEEDYYAPHQLTTFVDDVVRAAFPSPVDNNVIFFADYQGNENFQIYQVDAFHGWPEPITQSPKVKHEWGRECFSNDGRYIVYSSNERDPSDMLIYIKDTSQRNETICITNSPGWYIPGYWSPDNKKINCIQQLTDIDSQIWLLDVDNGEMSKKMPTIDERSQNIAGPWSSDGRGFYLLTNQNHENISLFFYDIYKSELENISTPNFDIEHIELSRDGKVLVWCVNENGYSQIYTKKLLTNHIEKLQFQTKGVIERVRISADGRKIGLMMTTPRFPVNIYTIDLNTKRVERLTNALLGNIPEDIMVEPDLIRYKSFDGLEISSFLYKPRYIGCKRRKAGVVLSIHGGPIAQERPEYTYEGLYQYLISKGLAVMAPNFRGSTGYGRSFEKKIFHDWGGDELKDLEYAVKWLLSQEWVDCDRIGIFGASFGGFAVLSCVSRLPQYWRAAVDIFGPSNLITTTTTAPAHWRQSDKELIGDPNKEEDFLKERSPITYVENIKADMLIIQGMNDPKVVKYESDQIVERLRRLGRNVEYIVFEDEGHGFTKYNNMIKANKMTAEFLIKRLS
jgi:dipeptidyl aminopeptidase/acylaminoacyl peptidase